MGFEIQRLSFGGIFDQSFRLVGEHFVPLSAGFAALYVPVNVVASGIDSAEEFSMTRAGLVLLAYLVMMALAPLCQLTATFMIADTYLSRPTTFQTAFDRAKGIYWRYLGTALLVFVFLFLLVFVFVIPAIYFAVAWMLVGPIGVVEDIFGRGAIKRSRELVRGHWWRTLGVVLIGAIASSLASAGFSLVFAFIPIVAAICSGLIQAVFATYLTALQIVLYLDLRCRRENFDLELLARSVGGDRTGRALPLGTPGGDATAP